MADYFCENCHAHAEVADACVRLNAAQPGAYDAATSLLPFAAICEHCGSPIIVPRPSIYIDHDRRFAVRLRPSGFRMPLYDGPLDYTLRDTQLLLDFREKVLLLSRGYDDVAVEFLKQQTKKANPETGFVDIVLTDVQEDYLQMQGILPDAHTSAYLSMSSSLRRTVSRPMFASVVSWLRLHPCAFSSERTASRPSTRTISCPRPQIHR